MTRLLLVVGVLLFASPAFAQTEVADIRIPSELFVDVPTESLRWVTAQPIEADGNPRTTEWLLHHAPPETGEPWRQWYRVAVVGRSGYVCAGAWFRPNPYEGTEAKITINRAVNGRDQLIVNWSLSWYFPQYSTAEASRSGVRVVSLDPPPCS